jgi:dihydrofolate reductase
MISIIAAVAENGVIGSDGKIPWNVPSDRKFFRKTTMGKPVIMGRKTWDSLLAPLEGRQNIVITRQVDYKAEGAHVCHDIQNALVLAHKFTKSEIMVIGGAQVYAMIIKVAHRIYLTTIHASPAGDTFFPALNMEEWRKKPLPLKHNLKTAEDDFHYSLALMERQYYT